MYLIFLGGLAGAAEICPCAGASPERFIPQGGQQCRIAIAEAEQAHAVPSYLLAAIGQVESGRWDPVTRQLTPWPWTINVGGKGTFFSTEEDAIAAVRALQAQGVRSIDVGCVQINLAQHPAAFRSLEEAFDPEINTRYGASFLAQLFAVTKDWSRAAAVYHSTTPVLGTAYEAKVVAALSGSYGRVLPPSRQPALVLPSSPLQQLAVAWASTLDDKAESSNEVAGLRSFVVPSSRVHNNSSTTGHYLAPNRVRTIAAREPIQYADPR